MTDQPDVSSAANVAGASAGLDDQDAALKNSRLTHSIARVLAFEGFTMWINGIGSPWIAKSFHLGESGIAGLFAWISLSAIGALGLSRMIDRLGRRRMLLVCVAGTSVSALAAAFSTNIAAFAVCEIALYAFAGATIADGVVILAEELAIEERARGQSWGGLGAGLGGGLCSIVMPMVRDILVAMDAGAGVGDASCHALAGGAGHPGEQPLATRRRDRHDFGQQLLRRIRTSLSTPRDHHSALLVAGQHRGGRGQQLGVLPPGVGLGFAPGIASALMLVGGGVGMLGFPVAARNCERYGRIPTIFVAGLTMSLGAVAFYWGPPPHLPLRLLWIGATYCCFTAGLSAGQVGGNSLATELFPTAIRGAMMGWFALVGAAAAISAQTLIAVLAARLGGLSIVVGYLSMLAIPNVIIIALFLPETRGLSLESAAMEDAFEKSR